MASVGFHLLHIAGVTDRMFTYALLLPLSEEQLVFLDNEKKVHRGMTKDDLLNRIHLQVEKAIEQLKQTDGAQLTETRYLGRKKIPTTLIGLLFHPAEHAMRHLGQLLVTARMLAS